MDGPGSGNGQVRTGTRSADGVKNRTVGQRINRIQSFRYAFSGIWYTLRTQRNAQIHMGIATVIVLLGLFLELSLTEWAILVLTTGFVITAEMLNTATEAAMDFATTEFNPQVKVVKDVAAGAVLISAITAVVVGIIIFAPPLLRWLWPLLP